MKYLEENSEWREETAPEIYIRIEMGTMLVVDFIEGGCIWMLGLVGKITYKQHATNSVGG